jgi:uncharacterized membrane protein YeaQ/YmgE (transglycosylase-associated protein family)
MNIGVFLSWMVCGLIVSLVARLFNAGREHIGLLVTIVLGTIGAVAGGLLYSLIQGVPSAPLSLVGNAWHGWIVAMLGSVIILFVHGRVHPKKWWQ